MAEEFAGDYAEDLALALDIVDAVDAVTSAGAQGVFEIEMKPDDTPVTAVPFGFATVIVPPTTMFCAIQPVCLTSTFHATLPDSPGFRLSWPLSTDFSTSHV